MMFPYETEWGGGVTQMSVFTLLMWQGFFFGLFSVCLICSDIYIYLKKKTTFNLYFFMSVNVTII